MPLYPPSVWASPRASAASCSAFFSLRSRRQASRRARSFCRNVIEPRIRPLMARSQPPPCMDVLHRLFVDHVVEGLDVEAKAKARSMRMAM